MLVLYVIYAQIIEHVLLCECFSVSLISHTKEGVLLC